MTNYQLSDGVEYRARSHINIYDSPKCDRLATQAALGRHLRLVELPLKQSDSEVTLDTTAVMVRLCEDDYPGWLDLRDVELLEVTEIVYHADRNYFHSRGDAPIQLLSLGRYSRAKL
jgi:hypothetical protein